MWKRSILTIAFGCGVVGCAAVPPPPEADGILVENIVDEIQCELASVFDAPHGNLAANWASKVTLNLKVIDSATAGAPTATITPILPSGTLTVPVGPDLTDQSTRDVELVYNLHLRDLRPSNQKRKDSPICPLYSGMPQAAHGLGLSDWLATAVAASSRYRPDAFDGSTYDLEFNVLRGVHGGITFQSTTVNIQAGANAISKTNDNHLTVAFTYDPPSGASGARTAGASGARTAVSSGADFKLSDQTRRFLPQRVILQTGSGVTIIP